MQYTNITFHCLSTGKIKHIQLERDETIPLPRVGDLVTFKGIEHPQRWVHEVQHHYGRNLDICIVLDKTPK